MLNFRKRELRFGSSISEIERGLSIEEYAEIWNNTSQLIAASLSPGAYAQWEQVSQEFENWYVRATEAWRREDRVLLPIS